MPGSITPDDVEVVTTQPVARTKRRYQPKYAVIVENDDDHTFPYVIEVLQKTCGHKEQDAELLAKEIHHTGRAVVWSGSFEVAELKRDLIRGYGPDPYASKPVTYPLGCYLEPLTE